MKKENLIRRLKIIAVSYKAETAWFGFSEQLKKLSLKPVSGIQETQEFQNSLETPEKDRIAKEKKQEEERKEFAIQIQR